jgi:hypothetical protein
VNPEVSVIVPAWGDRPQAAGAVNAYRDACEQAGVTFELIRLERPQVWGAAICLGLARSSGDFVLAGVDDLLAIGDAWLRPALETASDGHIVGAVVLDPVETPPRRLWPPTGDGAIPFAMSPLAHRKLWQQLGPLPPTHAYTDIYVADKARSLGRRVVCCEEWQAVHLCQGVASLEDGQVYDVWRELYLHD